MAKRQKEVREKIYDNESGMLALLEKVLLENGFEVYKEVSTPNGYCDIVAVIAIQEKIYHWGIEGKMMCNEAVITQAHNNRKYFDYVSICTPKEPNWIYTDFLKRNGIGCIEIPQANYYEENGLKDELRMYEHAQGEILPNLLIPTYSGLYSLLLPVINAKVKKGMIELHEMHKSQLAGKSAGERITNYKLTVMKIKEYLKGKDWVLIPTILEDLKAILYWSNPRAGLYNVCQWEASQFESKREGRATFIRAKE